MLYKFCSSDFTRAAEEGIEFISLAGSNTPVESSYQEDLDDLPTTHCSLFSALLMLPLSSIR